MKDLKAQEAYVRDQIIEVLIQEEEEIYEIERFGPSSNPRRFDRFL